MQSLIRRETLTLAAAGGAACFTQVPAQAQARRRTFSGLARAIHTFNAQAAKEIIGKTQQPLSEDEVIAAIRWTCAVKSEPDVTDAEYAALLKVADTGQMSPGAELEVQTAFEPNEEIIVTAWSVRLRMPHGKSGGTYAFPIREQKLASRLIGPEEREVIQKWEKKWREQGGIAGFDRVPYAEERNRAAQIDQAKSK